MKVAFLGDSLTFGYGVAPRSRWVNLAAQGLGIERLNHGLSGDTTGGMLVRLYTDVLPQAPHVVFFMGGFNDLVAGQDLAVPKANTMAILQAVSGRGMLPVVGITPALPEAVSSAWAVLCDMARVEDLMSEYSDWIRSFSKGFGVPCIDFRAELLKSPDSFRFLDGIHLDEAGHRRMAEIFVREFRKLPLR